MNGTAAFEVDTKLNFPEASAHNQIQPDPKVLTPPSTNLAFNSSIEPKSLVIAAASLSEGLPV
ncbi:hypothetical protein D3C72_1999390 [compost metagenome]